MRNPSRAPDPSAFLEWYWTALLRLDPLLATSVGDDRFDDLLPDPSDDGLAQRRTVHEAALRELDHIGMNPQDDSLRVTLAIARETTLGELTALRLRTDRLQHVNHFYGPAGLLTDVPGLAHVDSPEGLDRYLSRLRAVPPYIDAVIGQMEVTARSGGLTSPLVIVDRVIALLERMLSAPAEASPFLASIAQDDAAGRQAAQDLLEREVRPAFERYLGAARSYRDFARPTLGLSEVPDGEELYASLVARWTTRRADPAELHEQGRIELARIAVEREELAARLPETNLDAALDAFASRVRAAHPDREGVLELVRSYVDAGWERSAAYFTQTPRSNCEVRLVEEFREADTAGAYYEPPSPERRGRYFVNAGFYLDPDSRLLHRLATTTFHEANPGHHFQMALGGERADLPALRRHYGAFRGDAFTEGWGLYAERLADEMGLYRDPIERLGMLDNAMLRAVRLVVDTGIHAFGWLRQRAVTEMLDAGLPAAEAEMEVDRYAADPAQALAYKVGELEIWRLRDRFAGAAAGRESISRFHDQLLRTGALPLDALETELQASWRS
jgi:uncharacterized protein (DUF885 family)